MFYTKKYVAYEDSTDQEDRQWSEVSVRQYKRKSHKIGIKATSSTV
jgi:hypothetical protein